MARAIVIRLPVGVRLLVGVFAAAWCGFLLVAAASDPSGTSIEGVALAALGGVVFVRIVGLRVVAHERSLVVRNLARSRRLAASDIDHFRLGDPVQDVAPASVIQVVLVSGEVLTLQASARSRVGRRSSERLVVDVTRLQSWLAAGSS